MPVEGLLRTLGGLYPQTRLFTDAAHVASYESDAPTSYRERVPFVARSCHLAHAQRVREAPQRLLRATGTSS